MSKTQSHKLTDAEIEAGLERVRSLVTDALHGRTPASLHPLTGSKTALRVEMLRVFHEGAWAHHEVSRPAPGQTSFKV